MTPARHLVAALGMLAVLGVAATAAADGAASLYERGVADMLAGRYETACPLIEESQRLDPRPGRLFTLAECEAGRGRLATAVARYEAYLAEFARMPRDKQAKQQGREAIAITKKAALLRDMPTLTLLLPAGAPGGTQIKRDGSVLASADVGAPIPVDPGEHVVLVQAPDGAPTEVRVTLARGEKKQLTLVALAPAPAPPPDPGSSTQRKLAYGVGGVGIAEVVLGAVLGALVLAKKGVVSDNCAGMRCNAAGADAVESAKPLGLVSTIGFVTGAAQIAAAVVLLATDRAPPQAAVVLPHVAAARGGATFGLAGVF